MAQLQSGKYTVAWFKLAEFVVRKEKERALGIYKLLSHSLPNKALSSQLHGDLLLSFSDEKAIDAYLQAASLYEKNGNIVQAAAIYEHIVMLDSKPEFIIQMFRVYHILRNIVKINKALDFFSKWVELRVAGEVISKSILDQIAEVFNLEPKLATSFSEKLKVIDADCYNYLIHKLESSTGQNSLDNN